MRFQKLLRPAILGGLSVAVLAAGMSAVAGDGADKILSKYEKTGEAKQCIRLSMVRDSDPLDDFAILFEVRGGAMFLNELDGRCAGLKKEGRFSYTTPQAQICEGDIITVTNNFGAVSGSCNLGSFQKLSKIAN